MKSQLDRTTALLALLLAIGAWSPWTTAGVSAPAVEGEHRSADEAHRPPSDRELTTSREDSGRNRSDSVIQCWQKGRLILDERNWRSAGTGVPGPVLHSSDGRFARLKLMQFGETFCTLRHGAR